MSSYKRLKNLESTSQNSIGEDAQASPAPSHIVSASPGSFGLDDEVESISLNDQSYTSDLEMAVKVERPREASQGIAHSILGIQSTRIARWLSARLNRYAAFGYSVGDWLFFLGLIIFNVIYAINILTDDSKTETGKAHHIGGLNQINLGLAVLPVSRDGVWKWVFGISFERALLYHKFSAYMFLLSSLVHMSLFWDGWNKKGVFAEKIVAEVPLYGQGAFITAVVVAIFALWFVRRKKFELFRLMHNLVYVVILLSCLHRQSVIWYLLPGLVIYVIDRWFRHRRSVPTYACTATAIHNAVKVTIQKPTYFRFSPGQYAFINVPSISRFQWHPISIASSPLDDEIVFMIKDDGDWTHDIQNAALGNLHHIKMDGAYGHIPEHYFQNSEIVLVAGGIGITPMISIIKYLAQTRANKEQHVQLHWAVQFHDSISWFDKVLADVVNTARFEVDIYLTREPEIPSHLSRAPYKCHMGRPSISEILDPLDEVVENTKVSVFGCGPPSMVTDLWQIVSRKSYNFEFHREMFQL